MGINKPKHMPTYHSLDPLCQAGMTEERNDSEWRGQEEEEGRRKSDNTAFFMLGMPVVVACVL